MLLCVTSLHPRPTGIFFFYSLSTSRSFLPQGLGMCLSLCLENSSIWHFVWLLPHHFNSSSPYPAFRKRGLLRQPKSLAPHPVTLAVHLTALYPIWDELDYIFLCQLFTFIKTPHQVNTHAQTHTRRPGLCPSHSPVFIVGVQINI